MVHLKLTNAWPLPTPPWQQQEQPHWYGYSSTSYFTIWTLKHSNFIQSNTNSIQFISKLQKPVIPTTPNPPQHILKSLYQPATIPYTSPEQSSPSVTYSCREKSPDNDDDNNKGNDDDGQDRWPGRGHGHGRLNVLHPSALSVLKQAACRFPHDRQCKKGKTNDSTTNGEPTTLHLPTLSIVRRWVGDGEKG